MGRPGQDGRRDGLEQLSLLRPVPGRAYGLLQGGDQQRLQLGHHHQRLHLLWQHGDAEARRPALHRLVRRADHHRRPVVRRLERHRRGGHEQD